MSIKKNSIVNVAEGITIDYEPTIEDRKKERKNIPTTNSYSSKKESPYETI